MDNRAHVDMETRPYVTGTTCCLTFPLNFHAGSQQSSTPLSPVRCGDGVGGGVDFISGIRTAGKVNKIRSGSFPGSVLKNSSKKITPRPADRSVRSDPVIIFASSDSDIIYKRKRMEYLRRGRDFFYGGGEVFSRKD